MTQFGLYSDFKMTPQEVNRVANLPEWTAVLEVMIKSRRAYLALRTTKQKRRNQRAQDRQAHKDFQEEHRLGHWQAFRWVCTATSANRTDLDNAVGLPGRLCSSKTSTCTVRSGNVKTSHRLKCTPQCIESIFSVQNLALITSRETGIVYKLGY